MVRRRLALAALAVLALAALAGCTGGVDQERLNREVAYDWETDTDAKINITGGEYHAVYRVQDRETFAVYRHDEIGGKQPVTIGALRFRYPNGTVVNASAMDVSQQDDETVIELPADRGKVAYTADTLPKSFSTPVLVDGSHEVVLPERMRIDAYVLGTISPGGYEKYLEDDRVHLRWSEAPADDIELRYYLERDRYLFVGLVVALLVAGAVGTVYFWVLIRKLEERRERMGLDAGDS